MIAATGMSDTGNDPPRDECPVREPVFARRLDLPSRAEAAEMIREIKGFPMLTGFRGSEPADLKALEKLIVSVSDFVEKNPQVKELDLNPVFAYKDGVTAVDARVVLES